MGNNIELSQIIIAIILPLFLFFGNRFVTEAQSARHFLKWTIDCAKGESITIKPRHDQSSDWKDPCTGVVERMVPLTSSCKISTESVSKTCKGYFLPRHLELIR